MTPEKSDEWRARLATQTAEALARRERVKALRRELAEARAAGLRARQTRRLERARRAAG